MTQRSLALSELRAAASFVHAASARMAYDARAARDIDPDWEPRTAMRRRTIGDRRAEPRARIRADVVLAAQTQFVIGEAEDLSERGLFVATDRALDVGTRVSLELTLADGQVLARGFVRWRRAAGPSHRAGLGVELEELAEVDRRLVDEALRHARGARCEARARPVRAI